MSLFIAPPCQITRQFQRRGCIASEGIERPVTRMASARLGGSCRSTSITLQDLVSCLT
jgi:hypothetical protein